MNPSNTATLNPASTPPPTTPLEFTVRLILRDARETPVQIHLRGLVPRPSTRSEVALTMDAFDAYLDQVDTAARVQLNRLLSARLGMPVAGSDPEAGAGTRDAVDPELVRLLGPAKEATGAGLLEVVEVAAAAAAEPAPPEESMAQEAAPIPGPTPEPVASLPEYQI